MANTVTKFTLSGHLIYYPNSHAGRSWHQFQLIARESLSPQLGNGFSRGAAHDHLSLAFSPWCWETTSMLLLMLLWRWLGKTKKASSGSSHFIRIKRGKGLLLKTTKIISFTHTHNHFCSMLIQKPRTRILQLLKAPGSLQTHDYTL